MKLFDYLDKSDQKLPVLVNLVTPQGPEGWIYKQTGKVDRQFEEYRHVLGPRVCLKIHSRHLRAPLRGIFGPNSVNPLRLPHRDQISHKVGRTADGKQFSNRP